jgi:superfamily II DNA or RNA helicase
MKPSLRPYQIDNLNRIYDALNDGAERVLYQAPTGSGKTVLFADMIADYAGAGKRALVLGHRDEIVQQISASLDTLAVDHGIIAPGYPETGDRVQVASVFTAVRRLDRLRPPRLLVIDEAHHAVASTWQRIIAALPDTDIVGVTATPRRLDGKPLDDVFKALVVGPSIASLIDDGWLAPVTVFTPPRNPDLSHVRIRAGDYAVDELSAVMSHGMIVRAAVAEYERLCADSPAIAFCVDIAHSKLVAGAFCERGYRAEHVDGDTPRQQRRDLIAALGEGRIDLLCNCGLISEGLDVPGVVAAILLRPTKSLALYLQMVGRALRPANGKAKAFVLDHAGNVYQHGLPTARRRWSLHGRLSQTNEGNALTRCPNCGAMNERGAEQCDACGEALHRPRAPRVEVAGRSLVEAIEIPVTNRDIANMGLRGSLRWAADDAGRLLRSRLVRIAEVRGYNPGWVFHNAGRTWEEAWERINRWRKEQGRQ